MKESLFNSEHVSRKRNRRTPTLAVRLEVLDGERFVTIRVLNDEYETARTIRKLIAEQKFRWEYQSYFGTAPLRIVEEALIAAAAINNLATGIEDFPMSKAA